MKTLKKLIFLVMLGLTLFAASACRNTFHGAGEDIERAGDKIKDAVN